MKQSGIHGLRLRKGWLCAAFTLALCLVTLGSALAAEFGVVYNTNTLNLRAQGSSASAWLGTYTRGTWVEINGSQNNFYYVRTPDGKTGYMSKNYISTAGTGTWVDRIAVVNNQNGGAFLNFRAYPGYDAPVLGIFYSGVPLYVLSESNGWYYVQINGQTGYVRGEYLNLMNVPGSTVVATIKTPNNTAMNMRSGPGSRYGVLRQFAGDRYVMVLVKGNGWWRVSIDGYTGYMSSDYLLEGLHAAKDIAAASGGSTGESYAVVNNPKSTQALNLRASASTGSAVLEKLYNGTTLWVDEQGTEWSLVTVQNSGYAGYVMTRYLRLYNLPSTPRRTVYHPNGSYVNLRSAPDMTYSNVIARVPSGRSVTIVSPGPDWCKVTYNGYTGYMLTYFLQ